MSLAEIKAITISQPYASLIASGEKWIENRTWPTNYRGELAIHAGKGLQYLNKSELANYPTSCIVAVCKLVACETRDTIEKMACCWADQFDYMPGSTRTWLSAYHHEHASGPWCWILEDIRPVAHFECRGMQGLWTINRWLLGV